MCNKCLALKCNMFFQEGFRKVLCLCKCCGENKLAVSFSLRCAQQDSAHRYSHSELQIDGSQRPKLCPGAAGENDGNSFLGIIPLRGLGSAGHTAQQPRPGQLPVALMIRKMAVLTKSISSAPHRGADGKIRNTDGLKKNDSYNGATTSFSLNTQI